MMSIKNRRKKYAAMEKKHFTAEEIVHLMQDDELEMNARKGGILAIKEVKKRKTLRSLKPMPRDIDLDLGC